MPARAIVAKNLAELFNVLSHPDRLRIVEELGQGEMDVNALQAALGVSQSRTSQNLAVLRSNRIVSERREGRHVFYKLVQPALAAWVLEGLGFLEGQMDRMEVTRSAIEEVKLRWSTDRQGQDPS